MNHHLAIFLAQVNEMAGANPVLFTYGPMGVILAWFMWRGEKFICELKVLSHRMDGLTRAQLMDLVNRDSCGPQTKKVAEEMLAKIAARNA